MRRGWWQRCVIWLVPADGPAGVSPVAPLGRAGSRLGGQDRCVEVAAAPAPGEWPLAPRRLRCCPSRRHLVVDLCPCSYFPVPG